MIEEYPLQAPPSRQVEVVGFGRRAVAYTIDSLLLSVVGYCLGFTVAASAAGGGEDAVAMANLLAGCTGLLVNAVYFCAFWTATGQTVGKMVMNIQVVGTDGTPVNWAQAFIRYFGYLISSIFLLLGFAWIAFDQKRQGWHDKMADTVVVRKGTTFPAGPVTFVPRETIHSAIFVFLAYGVFCLLPIGVIALLTILGPQIGEVFSEVTSGLE
jgi:uncharacterized RDD family membrane protein YckC